MKCSIPIQICHGKTAWEIEIRHKSIVGPLEHGGQMGEESIALAYHSDLKCQITFENRFWHLIGNRSIAVKFQQQKWNFIRKFPPMEILLNIWWKSLHRNSRYCPNHQNGVTSCFPKMVINMKKIIFCSESSKYRM